MVIFLFFQGRFGGDRDGVLWWFLGGEDRERSGVAWVDEFRGSLVDWGGCF